MEFMLVLRRRFWFIGTFCRIEDMHQICQTTIGRKFDTDGIPERFFNFLNNLKTCKNNARKK